MNKSRDRKTIIALLSIVALIVFVGITLADVMSGGNYSLERDLVSTGDSTATGGIYTARQAVGEAIVSTMTGGSYELISGYVEVFDEVAPVINTVTVTSDKTAWFDSDKNGVDLGATGGSVYFNSAAFEGEWQNLTIAVTATEVNPVSFQGATAFGDSPSPDTGSPWQQVYSVDQGIGTQSGIVFTFKDIEENFDKATIDFIMDNTDPIAGTLTPSDNSSYIYISGSDVYYSNTMPGNETLTMTVTDASDAGAGVRYVEFPATLGVSAWQDTAAAYTRDYTINSSTSAAGGAYCITKDKAGNSANTTSINITRVLSQDPPTAVSCKTDSTGSAISATTWQTDDDPYIYWTAPASAPGIAEYEYKVNNADTEVVQIAPTSTGTNAYVQLAADTLPNGKWRIRVRARNNVQVWSGWSSYFEIWVDDTPPTSVSVTSITENPDSAYQYVSGANTVYYNTAAASGSFIVNASATDAESGIQKINFPALGAFAATNGGDDATPTPYSWTYNWTNTSTQNASANITAYNYAGLTTTAAFNVYLDTTAPSTPGTPSTTTPTADNTPTWTWTASTDSGGAGLKPTNTYIVYWDTVAGGTTNSAYSNTNSYTHTVSLTDGTWYVKVYSYDNVNNQSLVSGNGSALIDATAPVINGIKVTSSKPAWFDSDKNGVDLGATGGTVYFNNLAGEGGWQNLTIEITTVTETNPSSFQGASAFNDSPPADTAAAWQQVYSVDQYPEVNTSQSGVVFTFKDTANNQDTATIDFIMDNTDPTPGTLGWTVSGNVASSLGNNKVYINGNTLYYATHTSGETTTVTLQITGASDAGSGLNKYQFPATLGKTAGEALISHPTTTCSYTVDSADIVDATPYTATTYDKVNNSAATGSITIDKDLSVTSNATGATETGGAQDGVAQSTVSDPAFTWSGASDSESGIAGYYWYFGTDSGYNPVTWTAWTASPDCNPPAVDTYHRRYLRIKTKDNVGNVVGPATLFTFIYFPACEPTSVKNTSTWYQGDKDVETFGFSHAGVGTTFTKFYYKWDRSASYNVTTGDSSDWTTSTQKNFTPYNSKSIYLHVRPANSSNDLGPQSDLGPFYFVDTERLLRHNQFFDDDGQVQRYGF